MSDQNPIDRMLQLDSEHPGIVKKTFDAFTPSLFATLCEAVDLVHLCGVAFGREIDHSESNSQIEMLLRELGLEPDPEAIVPQMAALPFNDPTLDPRVREIQRLLMENSSAHVRLLLLMTLERDLVIAITDLMRLRVTRSKGLHRLLIEGTYIIGHIRAHPLDGRLWMQHGEGGRQFWDRIKRPLIQFVKDAGLLNMWDEASSSAMHVRIGSVARGLDDDQFSIEGAKRGRMRLAYQEEIGRPKAFIGHAIALLSLQAQLLILLPQQAPGIQDDDLVGKKIPELTRKVEALFRRWEQLEDD